MQPLLRCIGDDVIVGAYAPAATEPDHDTPARSLSSEATYRAARRFSWLNARGRTSERLEVSVTRMHLLAISESDGQNAARQAAAILALTCLMAVAAILDLHEPWKFLAVPAASLLLAAAVTMIP